MKKLTTILAAGIIASSASAQSSFTDGWAGGVDFGLTLTSGNSDTVLINLGLNLAKETSNTQQLAGLSYTFGDTDAGTVTDVINGFYSWNKDASEKTYYGFRLEGLRDEVAEIDYRLQASALYGVYLIKNDNTTFALEAGPGYTVESLGDDDRNSAHLYVGQRWSHKYTDTTTFTQSLAIYAPFEDFEDFNFVFAIAVETKISENLNLRIAFTDTYTNTPADGLEENDLQLISGVSYKF